ncbi:MAG: site-specific DNA-methyltransferase [Akkermansia sp.]
MSYDRLTQESPVDTNITRLAQAFPSVVREGKVDFDALRQLLGDDIGEPHELYGLNWKGKAQARRAALTPSLGTLRPCPEESVDWDSTKNLYIEGDNLEVLKLLRKSYSGKVKMIYIDPPYNTGKEFVYPDDYQIGIEHYKKLTEQEEEFPINLEGSGRFHTDWLNMMYPRLAIARDLLADDGVIFISIDDNEVSDLLQVCDVLFGRCNKIAHICHKHRASVSNDKIISLNHNHILLYAKNILPIRENRSSIGDDPILEGFDLEDERGKYKLVPVDGPGGEKKGNPYYTFLNVTGFWRYSLETMKEKYEKGLIVKTPNGLQQKYYQFQAKASRRTVTTWWDKDFLTSTATRHLVDLLGGKYFDNPKNVNLILLMLRLFTHQDKSALILDFFSGSATTAHAVMQMNAEDGGKRRFIMVQLPEPCDRKSEAYKAGYKNICEIGKERIRRAGKKLKEEAGLIGQGLDTGFRVYKLDSSNVKPWNPDAEDLGASLDLFSEHLVEGRTADDLLTEVMLKSGIDLCEEMETREIAGHRVYSLGYGQFYACMDLDLAGAEGELALGIAAWHAEECAAVGGEQQDTCTVFVADQAFAGRDDAKMNFVSTLQQYGICKVKAL